MESCEGCGFVYAEVASAEVGGRLGAFGERYADVFARVAEPRQRPAAEVWSALEYVCHVRDVFRVQGERVRLALEVDEPEFVAMGRDQLAVDERYNSQDPDLVLSQLAGHARALGDVFDGLSDVQLARTGIYNWPERQVRTLSWLGRHTVHEGEHHLLDIIAQG